MMFDDSFKNEEYILIIVPKINKYGLIIYYFLT